MSTEPVVVLVVEDEPLIQELLRESLTEGGFEAEIVSTPEEALSLLGSDTTRYRALVTDIDLGGELTGWDVAKTARESNPDIPVVYASGKAADQWPSMGVPKSLFLNKPFAPAQIVTALATLLNSSPPVASG